MLAWFPDNGPFPYDNYIDHREKINFINHVMHKLNMANNVPKYVSFQTYGARKTTKVRYYLFGQ